MNKYTDNLSGYSDLGVYLGTSHKLFTDMEKEYETKLDILIDKISKETNEPDKSKIFWRVNSLWDFESFTHDEWQIDGYLMGIHDLSPTTQLFYSGFIMMWYGLFDRYFIKLCDYLELTNKELPENKKNVQGIEKAYYLFLKYKNYQIDKNYWDEFRNIRSIRNLLVHTGENLPLKKNSPALQEDFNGYDLSNEIDIHPNLLAYMIKYDVVDERKSRLTPDYLFCKHLMAFGKESVQKILPDLVNQPIDFDSFFGFYKFDY